MGSVNRTNSLYKRVGIVSLFGLYNYGNRLQGFALDRVLREIGCQPETIVLYRKLGISVWLAAVRRKLAMLRSTSQTKVRLRRFLEFVSGQNIRYILVPSQIKSLSGQYDYFCVGSDQIWNPRADLFPDTKLLEFANEDQRIAVAPSFGVTSLSADNEAHYQAMLRNFRALSVRENSAADIVEHLIGQRPKVLIDPTLALAEEQWREVASNELVPEEPYILTYFLGGWSGNVNDYLDVPNSLSGAKVIDLLDVSSNYYGSGPQDFIALIDKASAVLTDSFHASVFSVIFGTPFRVYRRNEHASTYSRIETLLATYCLDGVEGYGSLPLITEEGRKITCSVLDCKRSDFYGYLRKALDA